MRCALHAQHQDVVGIAGRARPFVFERNADDAAMLHPMDGIEAAAEQSSLRPATVKRNAQRKRFPLAHQPGSVDDILRRYETEGADLIVRPPAAPIRKVLARFGDGLEPDFDVHRFPLALRTGAPDARKQSIKRSERASLTNVKEPRGQPTRDRPAEGENS